MNLVCVLDHAVFGLKAASIRPLSQGFVSEGHARIEGQQRGTRYVATGRKSTAKPN